MTWIKIERMTQQNSCKANRKDKMSINLEIFLNKLLTCRMVALFRTFVYFLLTMKDCELKTCHTNRAVHGICRASF